VLGPALGTFAIAIGISAAFCCVAAVACLLNTALSRWPSPSLASVYSEPAVLRAPLLACVRSACDVRPRCNP
jgi:hypothetical protein